MAGKYSVKETIEAFDLGFALVEAGKTALADGKVNIFDLPVLIPLFPKVQPAVEGAELIISELSEMDEEDAKALFAYAEAKVGGLVSDPVVKHKILVALKAGLALAEAIAVFKGA